MPMCFNLFGELHDDRDRLSAVGAELFGTNQPGLEVKFEHSPGRRSDRFTNDGTAFDVALCFGEPDGSQSIVGIETKYHEHAAKEARPDKLKMPRYRDLAEEVVRRGIFKQNWTDLLGTELQQIWRAHLLLLSMLFDPSGQWKDGKYVLVHPAANPAFAEAGETYRQNFLNDSSTFDVITIEKLLEPGLLHSDSVGREFKARYLW